MNSGGAEGNNAPANNPVSLSGSWNCSGSASSSSPRPSFSAGAASSASRAGPISDRVVNPDAPLPSPATYDLGATIFRKLYLSTFAIVSIRSKLNNKIHIYFRVINFSRISSSMPSRCTVRSHNVSSRIISSKDRTDFLPSSKM